MRLRAADIGLGVVALVAAAVCARLGVWQLDRLATRRARNAEIRATRERPPIALVGLGLAADSARERRLLARGVLDYAGERSWRGRTYRGAPGVQIVTPLRLPDGSAVLVDRGWAPSLDARRVDRPAIGGPTDTVEVMGFGAIAPRGPGDVDPAALQDSLGYRVLPFVLQQVPAAGRFAEPPFPLEPRALDNGPHRMYAIQWFSFAVIIVGGTIALLRRVAIGSR